MMDRRNMGNQEIFKAIKTALNLHGEKNNVGLHEPYFKDTNALDNVRKCLDSGWVSSSGSFVKEFEKQICQFTGSKHAVAVTNGTVGLRLALHCIGVKPNDEVLIPSFTFVATANAISHLGAIPHFLDIDPLNFSLSKDIVKERLQQFAYKKGKEVYNKSTGRRISAIVPVHVFGIPGDILGLKEVADEWKLPIVEDSTEALGSKIFKDKNDLVHCGLIGNCGVISFNGNKLITTGGGGMIITNNENLASKCRHLSTTAKKNHKWEFVHDEVGWNDRMPNLNAALGLAQLEIIEKKIHQKNQLLNKYIESFSNITDAEIILDKSKNIKNNWLINLRYLDEDKKIAKIKKIDLLEKSYSQGIYLRPVWRLLHKLPMYKNNPKGDLKFSEDQESRIVSLPSSPQLILNHS